MRSKYFIFLVAFLLNLITPFTPTATASDACTDAPPSYEEQSSSPLPNLIVWIHELGDKLDKLYTDKTRDAGPDAPPSYDAPPAYKERESSSSSQASIQELGDQADTDKADGDGGPKYKKPSHPTFLAWIQDLENQRDKADSEGNFPAFKKATDEISAIIGWRYGRFEWLNSPESQLWVIYSIIRTRHKFMGQLHMLHDRYFSYDHEQTTKLLQTNSRFKSCMAAVLAIDTIVMNALNDDNFEEKWGEPEVIQTLLPSITRLSQILPQKQSLNS
ncbi:hypothetical protein [Candidatus Finniella inopinata]|uniref:Uncharacterized protein n=1 Tax=Candidatus Finniella inopinata TaxID=1696036 RepID=A0A4Q7DNN7_9PROT|nr:hypothetical protein [Candidatus Finniella inopinata]RZI46516.1 hypothetical protein EQU50_02720 [Candidatus Finniella inopinata]